MYFLAALAIYLTIMVAIALFSYGKTKGVPHFFVANRELGTISTASTTTATTVGGSATIVSVVMIYNYGLTGIWLDLGGGLGLIALGLFLAKKVRAVGVYSLPELVEHFYDRKTRVAASGLIIIAEIAWIALLIQALKFILAVATDLDTDDALLLAAAIFIIYTFVGGQHAVAYSDVAQLSIMIIGIMFIAVPMAVIEAGGTEIFTSRSSDMLSFPTSESKPLSDILPLFLLMFLPHLVGSDIYSKILSSKNEVTARNGVLIAGILKIFFGIMMVILTFSVLSMSPDIESGGEALPWLIKEVLPWWGAALVLVAFAGVMMSSADSCLLTGAVTFSNDIFRFVKKGSSDREILMVARLMIVFLGIISYVIAVQINDIIETLKLGYTVFASSIIIPVLFGFYRKKIGITGNGAIYGMISGGVTSVTWMYDVQEWYPNLFQKIDPIIAGMAACLTAMFAHTFYHNRTHN